MVGAIDSAQPGHLDSAWTSERALRRPMADLPPSTSAQIAQAAGLNERYVPAMLADRGWSAGSSTTSRGRHVLRPPPPRGGDHIARPAPTNLAVVAQFIPLLAEVEQKIIGVSVEEAGVVQRVPAF